MAWLKVGKVAVNTAKIHWIKEVPNGRTGLIFATEYAEIEVPVQYLIFLDCLIEAERLGFYEIKT